MALQVIMSSKKLPEYTSEQVAEHCTEGDSWIIVQSYVLDISKFAKFHPGGRGVIQKEAGKDATKLFQLFHHQRILNKYAPRLAIGVLKDADSGHVQMPGTFGDLVPYEDPGWYQRLSSPYYTDSHRSWRAHVRKFVDTHIIPHVFDFETMDAPPPDLLLKAGAAGLFATMIGLPYPTQYVPANVPRPEGKFDLFHSFITWAEISRCGFPNITTALANGPSIALSAIWRFGSEEQKQRVCPDVLSGRKLIALAISEPNAGSDVYAIQTIAEPLSDGTGYAVNGNKKWITNGTYADYFCVAVVTKQSQGDQRASLSLMLVERGTPGFSTRKVDIRGCDITGTAYLDFDNVRLPKCALIGVEGDGFKQVVYNFNGERLYVSIQMLIFSRCILGQCIRYALKRHVFGKPLSAQPVIRQKISSMARGVESYQAWLESLTFNMTTMSHDEAAIKLGDMICLAKAQGSVLYEHCTRESTMIFGGNSLHRGGVGAYVEHHAIGVKCYQIPAGAEDVMNDFAARAAFKIAQQVAKL